MLHAVPFDFVHLVGELVTGKSIPVLLAIAQLPLDRRLACAALAVGGVAGTCFSVWSMRATSGIAWPILAFSARLAHLGFSLFLSFSLLLSVAGGLLDEGGRGVVLSVVPAFCFVAQGLPERPSSAVMAFLLCVVALGVGLARPLEAAPVLRGEPAPPAPEPPPDGLARQAAEVGAALGRSLQLGVLAFYACVQHAPTQVLFGSCEAHRRGAVEYCSPFLVKPRSLDYCCFVSGAATWVRLVVWTAVCLLHDTPLHLVLEGNRSRGWDWLSCCALMTALLYQACWTATQIREQVLPYFKQFAARDRLRLLSFVLALSALFRQRHPWVIFGVADGLVGLCLVTTVITLRRGHGHRPRKRARG